MKFITIAIMTGSILISVQFYFGRFKDNDIKKHNAICRILISFRVFGRSLMYYMLVVTYLIMTLLFFWNSVYKKFQIFFNYIIISICCIISVVFVIVINYIGEFYVNVNGYIIIGNRSFNKGYVIYFSIIILIMFVFLFFLIIKLVIDLSKYKTVLPEYEYDDRKVKV